MKNTILILSSLFISAVFLLSSCKKLNQVCTDILYIVTLKISHSNSQPAILDSVYTIRKSTGERIIYPQHQQAHGVYYVLDDSYHSKLSKNGPSHQFTLFGFKNGVKIVEENLWIRSNGCHVEKMAGRDSLQL